jgi:hypothetical protein
MAFVSPIFNPLTKPIFCPKVVTPEGDERLLRYQGIDRTTVLGTLEEP